jgi:hypothetical protein
MSVNPYSSANARGSINRKRFLLAPNANKPKLFVNAADAPFDGNVLYSGAIECRAIGRSGSRFCSSPKCIRPSCISACALNDKR